MTQESSRDANEVVLGYCSLQQQLVERFLSHFEPKERERFSDVPRSGTIEAAGNAWTFIRHGAGVSFEHLGTVVDAHKSMVACPSGIDSWRLSQYLGSLNLAEVLLDGELVSVDDEDNCENLLQALKERGRLRLVGLGDGRFLYEPPPNARVERRG